MIFLEYVSTILTRVRLYVYVIGTTRPTFKGTKMMYTSLTRGDLHTSHPQYIHFKDISNCLTLL